MPAQARPADRSAIPGRLYWTAPYLAVVIFALAMLTIVGILQTREHEVERTALLRDVQWAERSMQTHLVGNEEFLSQLAHDIAANEVNAEMFRYRANQYLANNAELVSVAWVSPAGEIRWTAPGDNFDGLPNEGLTAAQGQVARHARELGRAAYGQPYRNAQGRPLMEVFVPVQRGRSAYGMVFAVYSIEGLLHHLVPPWFSDKYHLSMIEGSGDELVANRMARGLIPNLTSLIVFDPPGNGLALRATAIQSDSDLPTGLPVMLIVGLSVIVFWSLWALRGHMLKRARVERERDQLFNVSLDMLCTLTLEGRYRRLNPAFSRVLGYPTEKLFGALLLDLVHPEDQPQAERAMRALSFGEASTFEARLRCADGRYKWLVWNANPVPEDQVIYAVAHDVTGRKTTEEAWRAESAFRKAMEESVRTGLRATDLNGRIIYVNPAFCQMVGFAAHELIGITAPFPYWPEEFRSSHWQTLERSLSGETPPDGLEIKIRRKDGTPIDVRLMVSPLIDGSGAQTGWMAAMSDVTESKRIRAELQAAHERFVAVLDGLDTAVFVADAQSERILYANGAFETLFGPRPQGRSTQELALPQPEASEYSVDPKTLQPQDLPRELFDGQLQHAASGRWYHLRERASRWVDGSIVRIAVATDITDRREVEELNRQQEERLQRNARLITMGEMASTLAHELNQPLSAIANYSSGCVNRLQSGRYKPEELLAAMQKASHQADRAGKIIRRIRDFVRKSEPRRAPVALSAIVEDALGFAEIDAHKHGVRIENRISADLPPVSADRIMIEQVVLNLVKNGIEAMQDNLPERRRVLGLSARQVDRQLEISISDTGPGVGAAEREILFTAFYTTKQEGMGMGLSICRSIVEYHNGRLWLDANPEGGSIFRFTLPTEPALEYHTEPA
ncbi:PAS domain S-box protein [Niveibacterium sp. SC-1]|uniref:PAS domain-containing sensor histidine kinase n=1 Tax=Niveibacterium sp. SC-1 TaxID=3135646 RepID=UPI00311E8F51